MGIRFDENEAKKYLIEQKMKKGMSINQAIADLAQDKNSGYLFQDLVKVDDEPKQKKSKFGNERVKAYGINFDSKKEKRFYDDQKLRLKSADILWFLHQVPIIVCEGTEENKPARYIIDFLIAELDGRVRFIDVKPEESFKTDVYKLKKKLVENQYSIKIEEVYDV